jgi:hypothetical protein
MNRRKITNSGIALESGLGTICGFNAVTEAPTQIAVNERWTFLPTSTTANDYVKKQITLKLMEKIQILF